MKISEINPQSGEIWKVTDPNGDRWAKWQFMDGLEFQMEAGFDRGEGLVAFCIEVDTGPVEGYYAASSLEDLINLDDDEGDWRRLTNVKVVQGDLFQSEMQTLTNAVNCIGVMGAGIALGFANRFPEMLKDYEERCNKGYVVMEYPYVWNNPDGPNVLNFPTMYYPGEEANLEKILAGFDHLLEYEDIKEISSLAVPALGCGIGGLIFEDVVGPFTERLEKLSIPVELYAPNERALGNPHGDTLKVTIEPTQRT